MSNQEREQLKRRIAIEVMGYQMRRQETEEDRTVISLVGAAAYAKTSYVLLTREGEAIAHPVGYEWMSEEQAWRACPDFTSHSSIRFVEDEIARQGLVDRYLQALRNIVCPYNDMSEDGIVWYLLRVTPEERCRAALEVVGRPA